MIADSLDVNVNKGLIKTREFCSCPFAIGGTILKN